MSEDIKNPQLVTVRPMTQEEKNILTASLAMAEREKAAKRQEQKDIIKEAVAEALASLKAIHIEVTFAPVELRYDNLTLRSVMEVDNYRLTTTK